MQPFSPMRRQFELIRSLGIDYADLTDNHNGATLGTEYGFSASFSLDSHPATILNMAREFNLTLTSVCAHANLLDPTAPDRYGTHQIIQAIKLAHFLGVKQVITTEGDPKTEFGHRLTDHALGPRILPRHLIPDKMPAERAGKRPGLHGAPRLLGGDRKSTRLNSSHRT